VTIAPELLLVAAVALDARADGSRGGAFERYAEVLSGVTVAIVGAVFFIWPLA
jgi:hypothetical protein